MKQFIIGLAVLAFGASSMKAGAGLYIEDDWYASNGARIIVMYDLALHVVTLIMPDGHKISVAYDPAIEKQTLDISLLKLINQEVAK